MYGISRASATEESRGYRGYPGVAKCFCISNTADGLFRCLLPGDRYAAVVGSMGGLCKRRGASVVEVLKWHSKQKG
jgi:hypothetical protein